MKKGKLLSILSALTMTVVSITPVLSSAIFTSEYEDSYTFNKILEKYDVLKDYENLFNFNSHTFEVNEDEKYQIFMSKDNPFIDFLKVTKDKYNKVVFTIDHDLYYYDELIKILESYGYSNIHDEFDKPEYREFTNSSEILIDEASPYVANFYMVAYDELPYEESIEKAKDVSKILKEKGFISGGQYFWKKLYFEGFDGHSLNNYICKADKANKEIESVEKYINDNNLDYKVVRIYDDKECSNYEIIPNSDITDQERFELAVKLKDDLNITPCLIGGMESIYSGILNDSQSTIAGDVNLDGKTDIADVVAVSAYTGNNSVASEQQIINGDVHNTGDGLTANDALMIQQYVAGMIDSLE